MTNVRTSYTVASNAARLLAGMLIATGLLLAGPWTVRAEAGPSSAANAPQAALSIAVTDGVTVAAAGDQLAYSVTVGNVGDAPSGRVTVQLTMPGGMAFVSADRAGVNSHGSVTWKVAVPAHDHVTVTAHGTVGAAAAGLKGLAGVACVNTGKPDMLCSSDIDQIPGRSDIHAVTRANVATMTPVWHRWSVAAAGLAAVALIGVVLFVVLRRRRPRAAR